MMSFRRRGALMLGLRLVFLADGLGVVGSAQKVAYNVGAVQAHQQPLATVGGASLRRRRIAVEHNAAALVLLAVADEVPGTLLGAHAVLLGCAYFRVGYRESSHGQSRE